MTDKPRKLVQPKSAAARNMMMTAALAGSIGATGGFLANTQPKVDVAEVKRQAILEAQRNPGFLVGSLKQWTANENNRGHLRRILEANKFDAAIASEPAKRPPELPESPGMSPTPNPPENAPSGTAPVAHRCPISGKAGLKMFNSSTWVSPEDYRIRWCNYPDSCGLGSENNRSFHVPGPGQHYVTFRPREWWENHVSDWESLLDEHDLYEPPMTGTPIYAAP